jgi:hypothetical protein
LSIRPRRFRSFRNNFKTFLPALGFELLIFGLTLSTFGHLVILLFSSHFLLSSSELFHQRPCPPALADGLGGEVPVFEIPITVALWRAGTEPAMEAAPRPAANSWALAGAARTIARAATWGGSKLFESVRDLLVHEVVLSSATSPVLALFVSLVAKVAKTAKVPHGK